MHSIHRRSFLKDTRGDMAEGAIVLPIIALVVFALITLGMAGFTASSANNIAQRAARAASVVQGGAGERVATARATANQLAAQYRYGTYDVQVLSGGNGPGDVVTVRVNWSAPNWFSGLGVLFGSVFPHEIKGTATASFRVEGW